MNKRINFLQLSKTLLHALRHDPGYYGVELDDEGWVDIVALVSAMHKIPKWQYLIGEDIHQMVRRSEKQRFQVEDNKIRATYGHSLPQKIYREPATPPQKLYTSVADEEKDAILSDGLKAKGRTYLHLSTDTATAMDIGRYKFDFPALVTIHAENAFTNGTLFYPATDTIWLAEYVPHDYLYI